MLIRVWCFSLLVPFLIYSFKFQPNACNRCHNLLMISVNLNDIAILNIKGSDYHCIISHKHNAKWWFDWKKWSIIEKWKIRNQKIYIKIFGSIYNNAKMIYKTW